MKQNKYLPIVILSVLILFTSFKPAKDNSCEDLNKVYEDALTYFNNYKGEEKVKKTLFGSTIINDYKINLWNAESDELSEAPDLGCNQLDYIFIQSDQLAVAMEAYLVIVDNFESCIPKGYIKIESDNKTKLSSSKYIDQRDKDSFMFYKWPEFEISVINLSGSYAVTMRVMSKKMN